MDAKVDILEESWEAMVFSGGASWMGCCFAFGWEPEDLLGCSLNAGPDLG